MDLYDPSILAAADMAVYRQIAPRTLALSGTSRYLPGSPLPARHRW